MKGGMTPFEALPVLADELVATMPDKAAAAQTARPLLRHAPSTRCRPTPRPGDIPAIVKRSGKSTDEGIRCGRSEMSYFLGVAYLEGATVAARPEAGHDLVRARRQRRQPPRAVVPGGAALSATARSKASSPRRRGPR